MSSQSSSLTSATLAPGQLEGQPLPSGSSSCVLTPSAFTGRDTSSFQSPLGSSKPASYWEAVPIWQPDEALKNKQLPTPLRPTPVYQAHGGSESQPPGKAQGRTYTISQRPSKRDCREGNSQSSSPTSLSSSQEASNTLATLSSSRQTGGKSVVSTSSGRQAQGSRRSSTQLMATAKFTLSQARGILGSTNMMASQFSSLTSIRTALNAKHSLGGWMATLSKCKSKDLTSLLNGLKSTSSRTTTGTSSGTKRSRGGSRKEESSSSSDQEATTTTCRDSSKENSINLCEFSNEEEEEDYPDTEDEQMINDEQSDSDYECYGDYD